MKKYLNKKELIKSIEMACVVFLAQALGTVIFNGIFKTDVFMTSLLNLLGTLLAFRYIGPKIGFSLQRVRDKEPL